MQLLSCEHPVRVFNRYINEYISVPCGKCNMCRNARAARWTDALERERLMRRYCLFVTLTYSDKHLPLVNLPTYEDFPPTAEEFSKRLPVLESNRIYDSLCVPFSDFNRDLSNLDKDLFFGLYDQFGGIPYPCLKDIQYFHKRLNKYFHDNVTQTFKNFRYFGVSEYGSTTLRPHWHFIYFTDSPQVFEQFSSAVDLCWQLGITDCKSVEKSACSYVAQYINKFADLPLFYQKGKLATKYVFSKFPVIGQQDFSDSFRTGNEYSETIQEVFDNSAVTISTRAKADPSKFEMRSLDKSTQNRLFAKCPSFKSLSDSCRIELYNIACRFSDEIKGFKEFFCEFMSFMRSEYLEFTEFKIYLKHMFLDDYDSDDDVKCDRAFGWIRRLYYLSRKVIRQACIFKVSIPTYVGKIIQYYNNKDLYLLKVQYQFQESYVGVSDDLALLYPDYIHDCGYDFTEYIEAFSPQMALDQIGAAAYYAYSNKKTHFKNAYLDSLRLKDTYITLFLTLKNYFYAKKCYETLEAFAA